MSAFGFIDNTKEEVKALRSRIKDDFSVWFTVKIIKAIFSLLPKHVINVTDVGEMVKMLSMWDGDLQSPSSLRHEISLWKRKWPAVDSIDSKFDNLMECLSELDGDIFTNLQKLSIIGCTLPVTSCVAERSFSVKLRTKTYLRSTMGRERFSELALVNIYPEVELDIDILTKKIVQMYNRRIILF